jgi:hypothetical protein
MDVLAPTPSAYEREATIKAELPEKRLNQVS